MKRFLTHLDNPIHANLGLVQNRLDIITALLCLLSDIAFDQVALAVCRDLARNVNLWAGDDGLALLFAIGIR